jgi:hypothetical protein
MPFRAPIAARLLLLLAFVLALLCGASAQPYKGKNWSVKAIDAWIARLLKDEPKGEKHSLEKERSGQEEEKVDYLRSLGHYMRVRSYPFDTFDPANYGRAVAAKKALPKASIMRAPGLTAGQWEFVGPKNLDVPYRTYYGVRPTSGRVGGLAVDPSNPQVIYLAASNGGVWKTTDGGVNWLPKGDNWEMTSTSCVTVDPNTPNTVYVGTGDFHGGTGYPFGLRKSIDGGETWSVIDAFGGRTITAVWVQPGDSQTIVVAATSGSNGFLYRSTNGGATWNNPVSTQAGWNAVKLGAPDANGKRTLYASACYSGRVIRSSDNGATWQTATAPYSGGTSDIAPSTITAGTVYLVSGDNQAIYKSTDFGATWTNTTNNFPSGYNWSQSWYDWHITTSSANGNDVIYVGLIDICSSRNGGQTWDNAGRAYFSNANTHNDQHCATVDPSNPNRVIFGNDGGAYELLYNPANDTWAIKGLSKTLGITMFYDADWHPTDASKMIGGSQDNATPVSLGDLLNWRNVGGGDGFQAWIHPLNGNIQYTTIYSNIVIKTSNGWQSDQDITPNLSDPTPFVTPVEGDPNDLNVVYTGNAWLHRYNGSSWTQKLGNQRLSNSSNNFITAIRIAVGDSNRIYVGTEDGRLWMSTNGGANWTNIRDSIPNRYIASIEINPSDKNDILVGLGGFGTGHLWRCPNTTAGARTWTNVSGSGSTVLPDVPLGSIARMPLAGATEWYVGTDLGVFYTQDGGANWANATEGFGLPNVQVSALEYTPATGYLNAATYGRGMWRLFIAPGPQLTAVSASPNPVVGGQPSTGTVTLDGAAADDTVITLTSGSPVATVPASVTILKGAESANFPITTAGVVVATPVTITAKLGLSSKTTSLVVNPVGVASVTLPANVVEGYTVNGSVTLDNPAPAGGSIVQLTSSADVTVPATVTVIAGQTSATFAVTAKTVFVDTTATVTATLNGISKTASLVVKQILVSALKLIPTTVPSGGTSKATVTISNPAPAAGIKIAMKSGNAIATIPTQLTIPVGSTTGTVTITTKSTLTQATSAITASRNGSVKSAILTVTPIQLNSITVPAGDKPAGTAFEGTVTLTGKAPTGGAKILLTVNNVNFLTVPASVTVSEGATSATFRAVTKGVAAPTTAYIYATLNSVRKAVALRIVPAKLISLVLSPSPVIGGRTVTGTATIDGPAPSGGLKITLTSSNQNAAPVVGSIDVPAGARFVKFYIYTKVVRATTRVSVSASQGGITKSATLEIRPEP